MKPISSTWPTSAQLGPPAAPTTRAKLVPTVSPQTAANAPAASRQTAAARSSRPDGPGARSRSFSNGGSDTAGDSTLTRRGARAYSAIDDFRLPQLGLALAPRARREPALAARRHPDSLDRRPPGSFFRSRRSASTDHDRSNRNRSDHPARRLPASPRAQPRRLPARVSRAGTARPLLVRRERLAHRVRERGRGRGRTGRRLPRVRLRRQAR